MEPRLWLTSVCRKNEFEISDTQVELIEQYITHLLEWNQKINLISRRDEANIWSRHILGSISFLFQFQLHRPSSLVDVGTGGGLPGIPLAILLPDVHVTLVDSIQKKVLAVKDIISHLGLFNVDIIAGRAEELAKKDHYRNQFDYVVARAVASTKDTIKWCQSFLRPSSIDTNGRSKIETHRQLIPKGRMLLLKGGELESEVRNANVKFRPRRIDVHPIVVQGIDEQDLADKKLVIVQL